MRKTYINKIGKQGRINLKANQNLKELWEKMGIERCEAVISEKCSGKWGLTNAHRHKRWEYIRFPNKLSDYNQVIRACLTCHQLLEVDKELTEVVFIRLRGEDNLTIKQ